MFNLVKLKGIIVRSNLFYVSIKVDTNPLLGINK